MGRKRINLIGKRFGKLIVVEEIPCEKYKKLRCKCDCGGEIITSYSNLAQNRRVNIISCKNCRPRARKLNDYEIEGDIVKIKLTNGVAIVDLEDWDKLKDIWWNDTNGYNVIGLYNGKTTSISRAILGEIPKGYYVAHKDRNSYNNRKNNLILVEHN